MKAVQFARFGNPAEVAELIDLPDPPPPGPGEALIEVEASPINPADLLYMQGLYGIRPPLPAASGGEGVGRVVAVGEGVRSVKVGDRVMLPMSGRGAWVERMIGKAERLFALPPAADPLQLAMLRVNPPTAWLMLTGFVTLVPGDWAIQNAANSGVGHNVIALARTIGARTVNVVRREDQIEPLKARGSDVVLVDGADLPRRVAAATGNGAVKLGIDAVAGEATERLAGCLAEGGTVVNYGRLSGESCRMAPADTIFRNVGLRGFWLAMWFRTVRPEEQAALYLRLVQLVENGTIAVDVEATYPLARAREALAHAAREGRGGKILLTMGGGR